MYQCTENVENLWFKNCTVSPLALLRMIHRGCISRSGCGLKLHFHREIGFFIVLRSKGLPQPLWISLYQRQCYHWQCYHWQCNQWHNLLLIQTFKELKTVLAFYRKFRFLNTLKYFFGDSGSCNNENYCFQGLRRWPLSCTVIIINVTVVVVDHVKDAWLLSGVNVKF